MTTGRLTLYWGNNGLWYVKLTRSMVDYNGEIMEIPLTEETVGGYEEKYKDENGEEQTRLVGVDKYEEGPWAYKRGEKYYLVYAAGGIPEHLSYSMSDSPTGPWKYQGRIMDSPDGVLRPTHPWWISRDVATFSIIMANLREEAVSGVRSAWSNSSIMRMVRFPISR